MVNIFTLKRKRNVNKEYINVRPLLTTTPTCYLKLG